MLYCSEIWRKFQLKLQLLQSFFDHDLVDVAVKPDDLLSSKIQSLCLTITGNVCCTEAQFETLRTQVQQAIPFLVISEFEAWELTPITANPVLSDEMAGTDLRGRVKSNLFLIKGKTLEHKLIHRVQFQIQCSIIILDRLFVLSDSMVSCSS